MNLYIIISTFSALILLLIIIFLIMKYVKKPLDTLYNNRCTPFLDRPGMFAIRDALLDLSEKATRVQSLLDGNTYAEYMAIKGYAEGYLALFLSLCNQPENVNTIDIRKLVFDLIGAGIFENSDEKVVSAFEDLFKKVYGDTPFTTVPEGEGVLKVQKSEDEKAISEYVSSLIRDITCITDYLIH